FHHKPIPPHLPILVGQTAYLIRAGLLTYGYRLCCPFPCHTCTVGYTASIPITVAGPCWIYTKLPFLVYELHTLYEGDCFHIMIRHKIIHRQANRPPPMRLFHV